MSTYLCVIVIVAVLSVSHSKKYRPTWESIDSRPLPQWFDNGKIGIMMHWGVFSVPGFGSLNPQSSTVGEYFWSYVMSGQREQVEYMKRNYRPDYTYTDFARDFTAEFYDADYWAELFEASGAKYTALTAKHHEGYANWPSNYSFNWNSMAVGPKRDLVGELAAALKKRGKVKFGIYHSFFEWFHPLWLQDHANGYTTNKFVKEKALPELYELVNKYKPELIWSDGDWMAPDTYWNSTHFLAWLYNDSPVKDTVIVNDRWGYRRDIWCKHGGYWNCQDRYDPGTLQKKKWESVMSFDKHSFGLRRRAGPDQYLSMRDITTLIARTVSCGGNLLINVGPDRDGRIVAIQEERLRQMGEWLKVNGEAIYYSMPWTYQNDTANPDVWYTKRKSETGWAVYAIVLKWPDNNLLKLEAPVASASTTASLLGYRGTGLFQIVRKSQGLDVKIPDMNYNEYPCHHAWVFKFVGLQN